MALKTGDEFQRTLGPFTGTFDSPDPGAARPTRLFDAQNVIIPDLRNGSAVVQRHGFLGLETPLGDAMHRTGQFGFVHHASDGSITRYVFCGGFMYRWDGNTTFTNITPAGIALHRSNPLFGVTYNDELILSDENNNPWIYTPSSGAAETIHYNTADQSWSTKGGPTIYGGAVFFAVKLVGETGITDESDIVITDESDTPIVSELEGGVQNTIVWGEPLDARTGYQQDNFDNAETLVQTSSEVIAGLVGEENALVYLRNKGIGALSGAVNEDLHNSTTRDSISESSGTDSPAAIVVKDRRIWYVDLDGRVMRMVVGGGEPQQLWYPVRRELEDHIGTDANRAIVASVARGAYHEAYNLVLFTIWDRQTIYAFDADTGIFVSTWTIAGDTGDSIHIDWMGPMVDHENRSTFVILGTRGSTYETASQGVVWRQKHQTDANQWLDQPNASSGTCIPITRAMEPHWITANGNTSFRAVEVIAQLVGDSARHAVGLSYVVPASGKSNRIVAQSTATVGEKSTSDSIATARWSLGRNAQGTGIRLRLDATHSDNVRWGVHDITLRSVVTQARPNAR